MNGGDVVLVWNPGVFLFFIFYSSLCLHGLAMKFLVANCIQTDVSCGGFVLSLEQFIMYKLLIP